MLGEGLFFERDLICSRAYSSSPIHKHHTGWHKQRAIRITLKNTRRSLETYRTTVLQIFLCMSKVILIWVTHVCAKLKSLRRSQGVLSYDIIGLFSSSPCLGFLTWISFPGAREPEFACSNVSRMCAGAKYLAITFVLTFLTLNNWITMIIEFSRNSAMSWNGKNGYMDCIAHSVCCRLHTHLLDLDDVLVILHCCQEAVNHSVSESCAIVWLFRSINWRSDSSMYWFDCSRAHRGSKLSQASGWQERHLGVTERRVLVRVIWLAVINRKSARAVLCSLDLPLHALREVID